MSLRIDVPAVFRPLWSQKARYKGAHGGRGSGKSHDRAMHAVVEMLNGKRIACIREVQASIKDSVKQLIEDKIAALGVSDQFTILRDEIRGPGGGLAIFRGLQDHTAESIKSLEGFDVAWIEEAQAITQRSLDLLTPTIRKPKSELWFTWNPTNEDDAVEFLRRSPPDGAVVVEANHSDNPFFPEELRADMERDRRDDPEKFAHVWNGGYRIISEGAYYARELAEARLQGRIARVPTERSAPCVTAWDLGVDDCTAIWIAQPIGREVRIIGYHEASDCDAAHWARLLKGLGLDYAEHLLPHDAGYRDIGTARTYEDHLRDAGLRNTRVLPRTKDLLGDINETRAFMAKCWFDDDATRQGVKALGHYRREYDDKHRTFRPRPLHDWASHGADAFRALATGLIVRDRASQPVKRRGMGWAA